MLLQYTRIILISYYEYKCIKSDIGLSIKLCEEKSYASVSRALTVFDVVGSFRWAVVYLCSEKNRMHISL